MFLAVPPPAAAAAMTGYRILAAPPRGPLVPLLLLLLLLLLMQMDPASSSSPLLPRHQQHHRRQQKDASYEKALRLDTAAMSHGCSTHSLEKRSVHSEFSRHPRTTHPQARMARFGTALYFSGNQEAIKYNGHDSNRSPGVAGRSPIPRGEFSVEVWVKPEGGQHNPVAIVGVFDNCSPSKSRDKGWTIGIHTLEDDGERDARFFFKLATDRAREPSIITSHTPYVPNRWLHLAATYDGHRMKFFINGAKVGVDHGQRGALFSETSSGCKDIEIGGNFIEKAFYRGGLDEFRIWNHTLRHIDVVENMYDTMQGTSRGVLGLVLRANFSTLRDWVPLIERSPVFIDSNIPFQPHDIQLAAPPCGHAVCDDPDVIRSYRKHWELRREKIVKYRVINVMDDDGSNPIVSRAEIDYQHKALIRAFKPYNITFHLTRKEIRNSTLRARTILFGCEPRKVGNGRCNPECRHLKTGNDGGDCDLIRMVCDPANIADGKCDIECNRKYHGWDGGDCCDPNIADTAIYCYNPESSHRAYLSISEYKAQLGIRGSTHLNVYFAYWLVEQLIGVATFPWEKDVLTDMGGTVVQPKNFGKPNNVKSLVHEFGHNLGLWHVHRGISDMECSDACVETHPSLELGDLCSDTKPTPQNQHCRDPVTSRDTCGIHVGEGTPYRNYMGYAADTCTDNFSPQQAARMHCYLDLTYQSWQPTQQPSPIPLLPKILSTSVNSVTLAWIPPLGSGDGGIELLCQRCQDDRSLAQYAYRASSPNPSQGNGYWLPSQATGAPDAESCKASTRAWLPEVYTCETDCYIDLDYEIPVVPQRLSIWVAWHAAGGLRDVELHYVTGGRLSLGKVPAYCDMPFTTMLNMTKRVNKVRIYTNSPYVSIDSVQIISKANFEACKTCKTIKYKIIRDPPFYEGEKRTVTQPTLIDNQLDSGTTYRYTIKASMKNRLGEDSPTFTYTHGQSYCGNGKVEKALGEECDDGNAVNGDGCSLQCRIEQFFHCKGVPSLCYLHDGDGICEEFEKQSSVQDCGFYTPDGFSDQWASSAIANPEFQGPDCPEDVVIGPPSVTQKCKAEFDSSTSWHPCNPSPRGGNFWLQVAFPKAVVATTVIVHLASDGITDFSPEPKSISVSLIDTKGEEHPLGTADVQLKCSNNPLYFNVMHDLSKPFFRTKGVRLKFTSAHLAIAAVALRSSKYLDPITISKCGKDELYNTQTGQCVAYSCKRPLCNKYLVKNGNTECTGREDGDRCKINCDTGYILSSAVDDVVCVDGTWDGGNNIKCAPVDCGQPLLTHAKVMCPDGTRYSKQCTFKCSPPALMQGSQNIITCDADGLWSLPDAYCKPMCGRARTPDHSMLISKDCSGDRHEIGTTCRYRCSRGYHIAGLSVRRRGSRMTCVEDMQWDGRECQPITCPQPDHVLTGFYNCSDGFKFDSVCDLNCPEDHGGRTSRARCLLSGAWDRPFQQCDFGNGQCSPPSAPPELQFDCPNRGIGSKCTASCTSDSYQLVRGDSSAWKPAPGGATTGSITCTGQRKWYPNPARFSCVEQCSTEFIADGWCDSQNNRLFCKWDGGDCCSSTVEGGRVRFVSEALSCRGTTDCTCRDPNARENRNHARSHGGSRGSEMNDSRRPNTMMRDAEATRRFHRRKYWNNRHEGSLRKPYSRA